MIGTSARKRHKWIESGSRREQKLMTKDTKQVPIIKTTSHVFVGSGVQIHWYKNGMTIVRMVNEI